MQKYAFNLGEPRLWLPPKILMIMKLIVIMMTTCLLQVSAASFAQKMTMVRKNTTLAQVFKEITLQTGYEVLYSDQKIDVDRKIDVNFYNTDLKEVLENCLEGQKLDFAIEDKVIVIKPKTPSFLDKASVILNLFQNLDVRGVVVDGESGNVLVGASVKVKGSGKTTTTGSDGAFYLQGVDEKEVIVVSFIGYVSQEFKAKKDLGEIRLVIASSDLNEVNVIYSTGYQDISKERATGSFSSIDNKNLSKITSSNILDKIEGAASGVLFEKSGNGLGRILIRSVATFADTKPLIVLDNFPYSGDIDNINPNNIENVTILKDAAAASIWGARAANGVIIITSKKATYNQKTQISFGSNISITEKPRLFSISNMTVADYVDFEQFLFSKGLFSGDEQSLSKIALSPVIETLIAKRDGLITEQKANDQINEFRNRPDVRNDYLNHVYREQINKRYTLSVNGGSNVSKYYLSVGYDKALQSLKGNDNDRLNLNFSNTIRPTEKLEITSKILFTRQNSLSKTDLSLNQYPYERLLDDEGNSIVTRGVRNSVKSAAVSKGLLDWNYRPLDEIGNGEDRFDRWDYLIDLDLKYDIFKGLNAQIKYQYEKELGKGKTIKDQNLYEVRDLINSYTQVLTNGSLVRPIPSGGIIDYSNNNLSTHAGRAQLNYESNFGKNHNLIAMGGVEVANTRTESDQSREYGFFQKGLSTSKIDYTSFYKNYVNNGFTAQIPDLTGMNSGTSRAISYFVNGAYSFNNKYIFSASARKDGSNLFGVKTNQKWKPLWSSGVKWLISKEPFYPFNWLPELNLRLSYGFTGTVQTASAYVTSAFQGNDALTGLPYARIDNGPNPNLRWEEVKTINGAIDFTTKNNRISGSIEYYIRNGNDLIFQAPLDPTAGYYLGNSFSTIRNYANTKGEGVDVNLSFIPINKGMIWNSKILLSYATSKPTKVYGDATKTAYLDADIIIGRPLSEIYAYRWSGLDPSNGNPQGYFNGQTSSNYSDILNNPDPKDLVRIGYTRPPVFGSWINSFSYKSFSLDIALICKLDYYFRRPSASFVKGSNNADYALRWKNPGDELRTNVPSIPDYTTDFSARNLFYSQSEILTEKGDNVKIQYINFSYTLSSLKYKKLPLRNLQLMLKADNLGLLWSANSQGIDPDSQQLPLSRSYTFGLNINF